MCVCYCAHRSGTFAVHWIGRHCTAFVSSQTLVPIINQFLGEVRMRLTQSSIWRHLGFSHLFLKGLRVIKFALMLINPPAVSCHCNHRCNLTKCIFVKEVQILLKAAMLSVFFYYYYFWPRCSRSLALRARCKYRNLFSTFILQPKPLCRICLASERSRTFVFQNCYGGICQRAILALTKISWTGRRLVRTINTLTKPFTCT